MRTSLFFLLLAVSPFITSNAFEGRLFGSQASSWARPFFRGGAGRNPNPPKLPISELTGFSTTDQLSEAFDRAEALHRAGKKVLFVIDIDNTLLASKRAASSDAWFEEHYNKVKEWASRDPEAFGRYFPGLVKVYQALDPIRPMRLTDADAPRRIKKLQDAGIPVFVLTSRSQNIASATFSHLKAAGLDFAATAPGTEFKNYKDKVAVRAVSYIKGVFFTEGLHKGKMLKLFLARFNLKPTHILFADDKKKNAERVRSALMGLGLSGHVYRYSKEDSVVADYHKSKRGIARIQVREFLKTGKLLSDEDSQALIRVSGAPTEAEGYKLVFGVEPPK